MSDRAATTSSLADVRRLRGPAATFETEKAVLGALSMGAPWGPNVQKLQPHIFDRDDHRRVFQAMQLLHGDGVQFDTPALLNKLQSMGADAVALAGLVESLTAATVANVEHHAAWLLQEWHRRALSALGKRLTLSAESDDATPDAAVLEHRLELEALERIATGRTPDSRFAAASCTVAELLAAKLDKPVSLIGDGLLVEVGFLLLYGRPGIGKTWAALQLAAALARGEPWLGFTTAQANVGLLSLELPAVYMQERLRVVLGDNAAGDDRLHIVTRPELKGPVNVQDDQHRAGIVDWCRGKGLGVVIVDALSRVHQVDENSAEKFGLVLAAVDQLREEAGCAVVLLHHEPKGRGDRNGNTTDDDLDAARGTSRLQSDPQTLLRLKRAQGQLQLVAAKVNLGPMPEPVWLRATDAGPLVVTEAPLDNVELGEANRDEVLAACPGPGEPWLRVADLVATLERDGLKARAIKNHIAGLVEAGKLEREGDRRRGYSVRRT